MVTCRLELYTNLPANEAIERLHSEVSQICDGLVLIMCASHVVMCCSCAGHVLVMCSCAGQMLYHL